MLKKELELLIKLLELKENTDFLEFTVTRDIENGFTVYFSHNNKQEKQVFFDLSKNYRVEFYKKDSFKKGTKIINEF